MLMNMENSKLLAYVGEKLRTGVKAEELKQHLLLVGWSEEEASEALVKGLVAGGVPTPERVKAGGGKLTSAVEVILNLFSFILLGGVASALIVLYYQIINKYFPDALQAGYGYSTVSTSAIHYSIAALIVGFPIYVATVRMWFKRYREDEAKVESKLTKWLTYLVLLAAAVTIVGDLVTALFYFLQGEVTARFFLKALTILVVFAVIFGFYYLERKKVQYKNDISRNVFKGFGFAVGVLVLSGITLGFIAGGSPKTERMRAFDETRAQHLNSLASCIGSYGFERKALPENLDALTQNSLYAYCANQIDPETGIPYDYRIITASEKNGDITQAKFELCANFSLEVTKDSLTQSGYTSNNDKWSTHNTGKNCDSEVVVLNRNELNNLLLKPNAPPAIPVNVPRAPM